MGAEHAKDITLVHAGGSYAAIKEIGDQASKDLGFKIVMQAITDDVQLNRSLTQPNTIDINNIDSTKLPYLVGKGVLRPIPVSKYKLWDETVPLFTKGSYPDGKTASNQGLRRSSAMFYDGRGRQEARRQADRVPDHRSRRSTMPTRSASGPTWSAAATRSRAGRTCSIPNSRARRRWSIMPRSA